MNEDSNFVIQLPPTQRVFVFTVVPLMLPLTLTFPVTSSAAVGVIVLIPMNFVHISPKRTSPILMKLLIPGDILVGIKSLSQIRILLFQVVIYSPALRPMATLCTPVVRRFSVKYQAQTL